MAARIKNRLGNAVFFITAAFWLHLLTLFTSCCLVHCQQLPFKYQQLQYKMLQQQQQQYEYQKHMQQLQQQIALQQQYKQQQQQQHEQQKQLQSIVPISVSQQQQLMLQQQQLKLQQQLEQQQQLELQLKKQQQLEEHLQRQKVEEQLKKQKQLQKIQLLQQLKIQQQQQQEKYTTLSMPMLAMLQQQKTQQQQQQQQEQMQQEQLFQQQQQKQKRQQQQQLEEQHFQRLQQQQQQQLSLQQEQLLQQYTTLPMSVTLQQLPQQQQQQHHQQQDARPPIHEQFYPLLSSVLPTHTQMMQTSASLVVDDCDSSELMEEESSEFNSNASHEFYSQLVPSTTKEMKQKHLQSVHADDNSSGSSDIASSVEDIPYWRGLVDNEFVPTAAAIRAPIPVRTKEPPSTTPATTSTTAPTHATAPIITEAAATLTTEATSTSTAATTAPGRAATSTARAATTTSIVTARSTVVPKATEARTDTSTGAATSTEKPQKDRRPKTGKRRRKPPAIREPLAALEKEQKLYELRDKQRQEFVAEVTSAYRDKSYRRPYAQAKREQGTTDALDAAGRGNATGGRKSADLKNILKNSGGLSLSEILQQKNLSLDDLLKGKQTALLALQTTAATLPQNTQKETGGRLTKPKRRISSTTTTTTAATSKELSSSDEVVGDNQKLAKNKLKLPMLQRLKLFGSSSRATASSGEVASIGRHREAGVTRATSTSTTTSSTPTTKRLPIYRKRQPLLQRSTLKPLGLLKSTVAVTSPSPPLSPTTTTAPIAIKPSVPTLNSEQSEEDDFDEEDDDNDDNTEILTTTSAPKPTTTKVPTTSATNEASSSVIAKIQTRFEKNPNTNIIDLDEQPRKSTETDDNAVTYAADEDLEDFFEESTTKGASYNNTNNSSVFYSTSSEHVTPRLDRQAAHPSNDYDAPPYVDPVDDRTDLLELIEDRRSGNRLFKVLEQRNMTLDELIEHRKRGSSQLHLAMVVQNRSRFFPDKKVILRDDMDIVTAFENFPHFNLMNLKSVKPDEIKTDSQGSSYFTSIIDIEPTDEIYRNENKESGSSANSNNDSHKGPTYAQPQISEKSLSVFPPWRTFNLGSLTHTAQAAANQQPFFLPQSKLLLDSSGDSSSSSISQELPDGPELLLSNDVNLSVAPVEIVEAIENEVERAHDLVDLELSGHGFKRSPTAIAASITNQQDSNSIYGNMPAGIRSAIAASAAIVLTSLATFMVIFIVCRWKQHRQRKTNFMKTYNAMRTKLPMVATTSTSRQPSLRTHDIEDSSMVQSITEKHQQLQQSHAQQQHNQPAHLFRSSSSHSLGGVLGGMGVSSTSTLLSGQAGGLPLARSSTSLTLSLTSTQENSSNAKLNTMDPNTQEMQEYLYDALRKSF